MGNDTIRVTLVVKEAGGKLEQIDERQWNKAMLDALQHANYLTVGSSEYETVEGRLNIDNQTLELLVIPVIQGTRIK
ncbi:hypothetical protein [Paenibacillus mendelii]|uniref:GyrI-like small molecule binding domain-containing protein n=1 Tax=Paenibacillus mendelii TaxID=206163 RepID=A0ABV6J6Y1_9BACL|nr:hypothetical protein [Paenibacillus mendelii]MCQ6562047.1 hypothetical protein [Paenibacillus mendelii]